MEHNYKAGDKVVFIKGTYWGFTFGKIYTIFRAKGIHSSSEDSLCLFDDNEKLRIFFFPERFRKATSLDEVLG